MEHYEIPKTINDSTVSKFVTRKWSQVNDLPGDYYSVNKSVRFSCYFLVVATSEDDKV